MISFLFTTFLKICGVIVLLAILCILFFIVIVFILATIEVVRKNSIRNKSLKKMLKQIDKVQDDGNDEEN